MLQRWLNLICIVLFLYWLYKIFIGTDSRLGLGFRVGPNADFQVLLELGPQTRTKNLEPDKGSYKKRNVMQTPVNPMPHISQFPNGNTNTPMGWLMAWKSSVESYEDSNNYNQNVPIDNVPVHLDFNTIEHLQKLYKEQPHQESNSY